MDVDLLPDAVFELDADGRVRSANEAASALTGYPVPAIIGSSLGELLDCRSTDGRPLANGTWHPSSRLRSVSRMPEHEVRLRASDGTEITVMVTGRYQRDDDGRIVSLILLARDGQRRPSGAIEGIEVISTVSHELRSPLTSVRGYTSLLLNRWDRLADDQKRTMLEQVNHDAGRVTRLVTELLDISRLESGRLVLRPQLVHVPGLVADVVEKVRMMEPELEVDVVFPPDFPEVYADSDKIEQVLTNLVENAAKYGHPKGMRISGDRTDDMVTVAVADRGDGISERDLRRIFTKFFRRAETRPTGSGLGLWISRGLVEAHGGTLVVSSQVGAGSTFTFTLPTAIPEELST